MKNNKRPSANYIRRFLPSLRRVSTDAGRMWTVDGETKFYTLQEVINAYSKKTQELTDLEKILNAGAEKGEDINEHAN